VLKSLRSRPDNEKIKAKIGKAPVVGADEIGIDIAGVLHWLWVWQTETVFFFKPHAKRGYKAIEDTFEEGLPNATLVTDRHAAYFNMDGQEPSDMPCASAAQPYIFNRGST
jgi:transposase